MHKHFIKLCCVTAVLGLALACCPDAHASRAAKITKACLDEALAAAQKEDWQACRQSFDKLRESGLFESRTAKNYLIDSPAQFRCALIEFAGGTGKKDAAEMLAAALEKETDPDVKTSLVEALGKLKYRKAVPLLEKLLTDGTWSVRQMAADALKEITGKDYQAK